MSFVSESRERVRPVLPLAGMVDILFLLLIFFMTASVYRDQELQLPVELPSAASAVEGSATMATRIVVTVTADDRVYLGEREMPMNLLRETFVELANQFPDETVIVRGDQNSRFGLAVRVMDLAQSAGLRNVSVATVKSVEDVANSE